MTASLTGWPSSWALLGILGAGIAQLACRAGALTLLHDPIPDALQRGLERARDGLRKEIDAQIYRFAYTATGKA